MKSSAAFFKRIFRFLLKEKTKCGILIGKYKRSGQKIMRNLSICRRIESRLPEKERRDCAMTENQREQTTVSAISTAYGKGGIALIRVSGPDAIAVAERMFLPRNGKSVSLLPARQAVYGRILYNGEPLDDGILTLYRAPNSYTGEDCAEISCHGGVLLSAKVYESTLLSGASPAGPGEFSKRAFLAGKISLTGAEAVIDLINAETEDQLALAGENSRGRLSKTVKVLYEKLTALLAQVYVSVDYPDEDLSDISDGELLSSLVCLREEVQTLCDSYRTGRAVMEGISTVIVGRPNTGKSSLLNMLLGRERAIVSPVAGTTRDTVEETVTLGRVLLRLCDTAGLRETDNLVEKMGVAKSLEKLRDAQLVLAVFDGSERAREEDILLIEKLRARRTETLVILNKSDLPALFDYSLLEGFTVLSLSALEKEPPGELSSLVEKLFISDIVNYKERAVLTNARQALAAGNALTALDCAIEVLRRGESRDMAAFDAETALRYLAETDGRSVGEDIVSAIFSRFCVGK